MTTVLAAHPAPGASAAQPETRVRGFSPLSWPRLGVDLPISLECTSEKASVYGDSQRADLFYLRARYYDPATGQFLTRDPLVDTTRSPYAYVGGDPLNATDPTGLRCGLDLWHDCDPRCPDSVQPLGPWQCTAALWIFHALGGEKTFTNVNKYLNAHRNQIDAALTVASFLPWGRICKSVEELAALGGAADTAAVTAEDVAGAGSNWVPRAADSGKGTVWQEPGAAGNANSLRIMDATDQYPNGYVRFYNQYGQPVGLDGSPGPNAATHIPRSPDGSYPLPNGW